MLDFDWKIRVRQRRFERAGSLASTGGPVAGSSPGGGKPARPSAHLLGKLEESFDLAQTSEEADAKEAF